MDKYIREISKGNLFKDELFIIPNEHTLEMIGKYEFPLLFIVNTPDPVAINEENKTFANSILKQIPNQETVDLSSVGVLNLKNGQHSLLTVIQKFKPQYIFTWGTQQYLSGLVSNDLELCFLGNVGVIQAPPIEQVKDSKSHKAALWQCMKSLFNIQ